MTTLRRLWGRFRADLVRFRPFDRRPRVQRGHLPFLDSHQQRVYDRACDHVERLIPLTGEKER